MSKKRRSELADRLLQSRAEGERSYNPAPCQLPTSPWSAKWKTLTILFQGERSFAELMMRGAGESARVDLHLYSFTW